jgi:hypothetical protein
MMARQRFQLGMLWWIWGGLLLLLMVVLSYQPILFGEDVSAVWEWFIPNLIPTLTLVSAVVAFDELPAGGAKVAHRKYFFWIAVIASVLYLLLLTVAVLSVLFVTEPLAFVHKANYWLGPVQGLSASTTGVFFTKQHDV